MKIGIGRHHARRHIAAFVACRAQRRDNDIARRIKVGTHRVISDHGVQRIMKGVHVGRAAGCAAPQHQRTILRVDAHALQPALDADQVQIVVIYAIKISHLHPITLPRRRRRGNIV